MISLSGQSTSACGPELIEPTLNKWMGLIASSLPLSTADMMFVSVRTRNKLLVQQKKKPLSTKCKVSLMLKGRTKMTE